MSLTLDAYLSSDSVLKTNDRIAVSNRLYIFPSSTTYHNKPFRFKFDKQEISLGNQEYFIYQLKPGETAFLAKGIHRRQIRGCMGCSSAVLGYVGFILPPDTEEGFIVLPEEYQKIYTRTFFTYAKSYP